jgi:hypothetical protein
MAHKRKRGELEPSNRPDGHLCEKCRSIFATAENLRMLASTGFKHYNRLELLYHATHGCTLCGLLFKGLENYQRQLNTTTLLLKLSYRGSWPVKTKAKSRYPGVVMGASCLLAIWDGGVSDGCLFDIVSAQGWSRSYYMPLLVANAWYRSANEIGVPSCAIKLSPEWRNGNSRSSEKAQNLPRTSPLFYQLYSLPSNSSYRRWIRGKQEALASTRISKRRNGMLCSTQLLLGWTTESKDHIRHHQCIYEKIAGQYSSEDHSRRYKSHQEARDTLSLG